MASVSAYGDRTFGTPVAMVAKVEDMNSVSTSPEGEEIRTTHSIFTEDQIEYSDRIWLPGDLQTDATLARKPINVAELRDYLGAVTHYETTV